MTLCPFNKLEPILVKHRATGYPLQDQQPRTLWSPTASNPPSRITMLKLRPSGSKQRWASEWSSWVKSWTIKQLKPSLKILRLLLSSHFLSKILSPARTCQFWALKVLVSGSGSPLLMMANHRSLRSIPSADMVNSTIRLPCAPGISAQTANAPNATIIYRVFSDLHYFELSFDFLLLNS